MLQNGVQENPWSNHLTSHNDASCVAIVDRTANVQLAAQELFAARFSFAGSSPYAPDCVFVNEFVKNDFLQAVKSEWSRLGSRTGATSSRQTSIKPKIDDQLELLQKGGARTILQESDLAVVEITSRAAALDTKTNLPILKVHGVRSLDDALALVNNRRNNKACLAAYHFGNLATGKYLSQFIDAEVSFINHVPREILVGPAAPSGYPLQLSNRYPFDLFTVSRPAYVHCTESSASLLKVLRGESGTSAQKLLVDAATPLAEYKRHPGGGVGFFEQGFLINAGMIVASTLTASAAGMLWWWKWSRST